MSAQPSHAGLFGVMAEFEDTQALLAATRATHAEGYRKMDAYSPFPVEGLSEALGVGRTRLPLFVLIAGIAGCVGAFIMQYWCAKIAYPINIGGRPLNSWPSFIPVTFELTVLAAALTAVFGMLAMNGLPMPYHPVFNVPQFALASEDRFFLCIESSDPKFDLDATTRFLKGLKALEVTQVER